MDLKKISDEDLWERLLGMVQDPCVAMASKIMDEIDRRNPPDSSRVRETAKEFPEGDYGDRVLAFDCRCMQWRDADVGDIRFIERMRPGKCYYTHWMPLPPAPKEADDGK